METDDPNYIDLTKQIMIYFIILNETEPAWLSLSDVEIRHPVIWLHIFCSQLQMDWQSDPNVGYGHSEQNGINP